MPTWLRACWLLPRGAAFAAVAVSAAPAQVPTDSTAREALVRALAPALARELRRQVPIGERLRPAAVPLPPWDVHARSVSAAGAALVRDSVLAATRGRPRTAADTAWNVVAVGAARVAGDSAVLGVDVGGAWCPPVGGAAQVGGRAYEYVFRRAAGRWVFAHVADIAFNYEPAPPPLPESAAAARVPARRSVAGGSHRCGV